MGLNYFMIEGTSSADFGVVVESADVFGAPARVYEEVAVPGRNGTLLFDEGRYENTEIQYNVALRNDGVNLSGAVTANASVRERSTPSVPAEWRRSPIRSHDNTRKGCCAE